MKKLIAVVLCMLVLLCAFSVVSFAEVNKDPSVEAVVENTIGKYIPTGKDVADNFFRVLNAIRDALSRMIEFNKDMIDRMTQAVNSVEWVPGWMR